MTRQLVFILAFKVLLITLRRAQFMIYLHEIVSCNTYGKKKELLLLTSFYKSFLGKAAKGGSMSVFSFSRGWPGSNTREKSISYFLFLTFTLVMCEKCDSRLYYRETK